MGAIHPRPLRAQGRRHIAFFQTLSMLFITAVLIAGCSGSDDGTSNTSNASTTNSTSSTPTALAVVKPVIDCAQLASVDLTDIGGAGSTIASATVTTATINGTSVNFCAVKGTLAPANTFEVALPVSTWTQRFAGLGCGGLCGSLSDPTRQSSFSFTYNCPLVQQGGS